MTIDPNLFRRYSDLFLKIGLLDDTMNAMGWMEPEYDNRSLRDITEFCSESEYLDELLTILTIGTPNIKILSLGLGEFEFNDQSCISTKLFNKRIDSIQMNPLKIIPEYQYELGELKIKLNKGVLLKQLSEVLNKHNVLLQNEIDTGVEGNLKVKRFPFNKILLLSIKLKIVNELIDEINLRFEDVIHP